MSSALRLLAGPKALALVRERGLRAEDVDIVPAASGGAKWLVLGGLDRWLAGFLMEAPRTRPLHLIGSSIGSWRLAALAQKDPRAALDRAHAAYIEQTYPPRASVSLITETSARILDVLLGADGAREAVEHPWARLHVITAACRGLLASEGPVRLRAGLVLTVAGNLASRKTLAWQARRTIFHTAGDSSPFQGLSDLPTEFRSLGADNLAAVLLGSAAIPLVLRGVRIPGSPDLHRDGGLLDYHLDLDPGPGDGLVLYPHFYSHVFPGWLDKKFPWRRARGWNLRRTLLISPSPEFVGRLPRGKVPDRNDFYELTSSERIRGWWKVLDASRQLAEEFAELVESGRLASRIEPI